MALIVKRPKMNTKIQEQHGEGCHGLFDYDLWAYDIGYAAESGGKLASLDWVHRVIDQRIVDIQKTLQLKSYEGFLTGSGNFRYDIAVTEPYKSNRSSGRPKHWQAIRDYLQEKHYAVEVQGIEADDALAVRQTELGDLSIIISRDKDLRQVPGWHYGYPVGAQPEFGPWKYDEIGELELQYFYKTVKGEQQVSRTKLSGGGLKFFYSQVLTGDETDTYPGLRGVGNAGAYRLLKDCKTERQMFDAVLQAYEEVHENALERMTEQARLAWMVREYDVQNMQPVMWEPLNEEDRASDAT